MTETKYYTKVNYRGKEKDYFIRAEEGNDIRIEYLDYNPERECSGIWIKNGKDKILKTYTTESNEHKYYTDLFNKYYNQISIIRKEHQRIYKVDYASLGTDHYKKAWRLAVNEVNKKHVVNLFPNQKFRG